MRRNLRLVAWGLSCIFCVAARGATPAAGQDQSNTTPAGYAVYSSQYVTAPDGTRIAIDLWLPKRLAAGERFPALMKGTPYWRAPEEEVAILKARGYAVVGIDARGSGASFGSI